ncbi:Gluconolactonase [Rubrivivax sp. A210]|uniref:SMP-30/gluconolactonase/LRE family protein n=1 Tax=Rubrivivax sp. A210 TaxID=2772301 RepID=UPI001919BB59|nr:SMP-30/gluconolactonase/LRE family protein [Rubrivivax sp. A210]CAD5373500.1 Gluconolactonase [Rubrivivax sp. A210]
MATDPQTPLDFEPSRRYPDPAVKVLDPSFARYRIYSSSVEQLGSGMRWAEGPVHFPAGRYVLVSDVPNDRIMRYDEVTGAWGLFRQPSNFSNGNARDRQGRLISCEHLTRRVTRTDFDGKVVVLADSFDGKRLNSPNDVVCKSDGSIWFTDPPFGIGSDWEGSKAEAELPHSVYRIAPGGQLGLVTSDLAGPNGLAFSPDEKFLYIVESRATPSRLIWRYDVGADGATLSNKTVVVDAQGAGAIDGFRVDIDGNLWCGWGSDGRDGAQSSDLDGVMVFNPQGRAIGFIQLPERCANLTFGGPKSNRLYMASSHSLYALYVNTKGAG